VRATEADVSERADAAFVPHRDVRIGAEVEWLVYRRSDPSAPVGAHETAEASAGRLPARGRVTVEPGGQIELVTQPFPAPDQLIDAIEVDGAALVERMAARDLVLLPAGLDPVRPPRRTLHLPRYKAMERHFAERWPAGISMMNLTASLQLNIDLGPDPAATWRRADAIAPVLSAAFANSPTADGTRFLPVSHRQRIWFATDPSRTRPVGRHTRDWRRYILDAEVMLREGVDSIEAPPERSTFEAWLRSTDPPSRSELELHLTTLFPPLRPRGFLELRMIDAVPASGRAAAIATVWALLTDPRAGDEAAAVCAEIADPWTIAAEAGLRDRTMRYAATTLLDLAGATMRTLAPKRACACDEWRDRIWSGRTPRTVDELLASIEAPSASHARF